MKEYKIYYAGSENTSKNFLQFAKETEDYINSDYEIIERAKEANKKLYQAMKEELETLEDIYAGYVFQMIMDTAERYMYLKFLYYDGIEYEAEIDLLKRSFSFIEV